MLLFSVCISLFQDYHILSKITYEIMCRNSYVKRSFNRFMSCSSTAVENRAIFVPMKRLSPGNREKKPTRVVGKALSYCRRQIFLVVGKALSHTWSRHNARRYCRRHIRTVSLCRHLSCCIRVVGHSEERITM